MVVVASVAGFVSGGFMPVLFGFGVEMRLGFGRDRADKERGRGVGDEPGSPCLHVVGDVEEQAGAGQAHHVGGRGGIGMGFGAGRQERNDLGEVAGDRAREIDHGEERGDDHGLGGFFGGGGRNADEGGQKRDGKDSQHGGRILGAGGETQAGLQAAADAV